MKQHHQLSRSNSSATKMILPPSYIRSNSYNSTANPSSHLSPDARQMVCLANYSYESPGNTQDRSSSPSTALAIPQRGTGVVASLIRSLLSLIAIPSLIIPATCRWLTANIISSASSALSAVTPPLLGHKVSTGTLFGYRKGHVYFAIQDHPRSAPLLILDLPMSTSALVKEMSSGIVRIALECDKAASCSKRGKKKLLGEIEWTMYCNSRKCGTARSMECSDFGMFVLDTVGSISVGAGVIPVVSDGKKKYDYGELMYMRARFERVVGNRDSEAFYMLNPDGNVGGPELSMFLLRL